MAITLPTWITLARLALVPLILATFERPYLCTSIFLVAALTDWLDGYLARRLNQVSDLGKWLDPLVDKLLILAPLLLLIQAQQIPIWAVFLWQAREYGITGWRSGQAQTQGANLWGKAKTVTQIVAIAMLLLNLPYAIATFWLALGLTLWSGWLYVRTSGK